ncbi:hypothetical protein ONA91_30170 [Micromonospora sp. DR5-3]|uniref:hypothetical protein n=1 Tax=unclassified Micromonospora TaxID=2617518 RepID=UPI0011D63C56|nr:MULTISPECIES: hypothetical protein [unclassified Micromonospora]MCW3818714.1 hypothetical protein [Micromonospora sp. DR5-3]TYC21601.1 hypothetical protein FXF52_24955 [Micromonospora sp. MP36]
MTDLDERIASVLRERAEGEIDTGRLLSRSRARGRRRRLRHRVVTGTALALVGVLGFVGVTGTDLGGLSGRLPWTAATPTVAPPVPPRADGVPGATQRPDLVGTDTQVLHLGVDTSRARYLSWAVSGSNQVESVRLRVGGGPPVLVEVSRSARVVHELLLDGLPVEQGVVPVTFDGVVRQFRNGAGGLVKAWQPVPGLYARASMLGSTDRGMLAKAVDALRWGEARRCDAPLRLSVLPEGAKVATCSVDATAFPGGLHVELVLYREPSANMWVRLQYGAQIATDRAESNRTVGGRPAYLYPDGKKLELLGIPRAHLSAEFGWPFPDDHTHRSQLDFTEADAKSVLGGAQVAKDLTDPETWK